MTNQTDPFLRSIGRKLKQLRQKAGLTQVQLAKTVELDYRHYQNLEAGHSNFKITTVKKLADFYNVTLASFFGDGFDGSSEAVDLHQLLQEGAATRFTTEAMARVKERCLDLPTGILQLDREGTIVFINSVLAKMLGKDRAEVEGKVSFWEFVDDEATKEHLRLYHRFVMEFHPPPKPYVDAGSIKQLPSNLVRADWDYVFDGQGNVVGSLMAVVPMQMGNANDDTTRNGVTVSDITPAARMARNKVAAAEKASH